MPSKKKTSLLALETLFRPQIFEALDMARYTEDPNKFSLSQELHELLYREISSRVRNLFQTKYGTRYETDIPSRQFEDTIQDFLSYKLIECFKNFNLLASLSSYISFSIVECHKNRILIENKHKKLEKEEKAENYEKTNSISPRKEIELKMQIEELRKKLPEYKGNQDFIETVFQLFEKGYLPAKKRQIFGDPNVASWIGKVCSKKNCPRKKKCLAQCNISEEGRLREWNKFCKWVKFKENFEW